MSLVSDNTFIGNFTNQYQRNNKFGGQKNLRCFPCCREGGHVAQGFCGQAIELDVTMTNPHSNIMCWGLLCMNESDDNDLVIGTTVPIAILQSRERSRETPMNELLRGKIVSTNKNSTRLVFNENRLGWHYGWVSTRPQKNAPHTFRVFVCEAENENIVRVLSSIDSPYFQIVSRRRHQNDSDNTKHTHDTTTSTPENSPTCSKRQKTFEEASYKNTSLSALNNRTLDRIAQILFRFGNRFYNTAQLFERSSNHQEDAVEKPGGLPQHETYSNFSNALSLGGVKDPSEVLLKLGQVCSNLLCVGRAHVMAEKLFRKWTDPGNVDNFFQQCTIENSLVFEWTPENEDETFDESKGSQLVENTIYAEFRQAQRGLILSGLEMQGIPIEYFHKPMELASRYGILFLDPFRPPEAFTADLLLARIRNGAKEDTRTLYGVGCDTFPSDEVHKRFAKDCLLLRRGHFRNIVLNRIEYHHLIMSLHHPIFPDPPLPAIFDFNGEWIDQNIKYNINMQYSMVFDIQAGDMITLVYDKMFSRVKLVMTSRYIEFQGTPIFLGSGQSVFRLDCNSHEVIPPLPQPLMSIHTSSMKPEYLGILHEDISDTGEKKGYALALVKSNSLIPGYEIKKSIPEFYERTKSASYQPVYLRYVTFADGSNGDKLVRGIWEFLIPHDEVFTLSRSLILKCFKDSEFRAQRQIRGHYRVYIKSVMDAREEDDMANMLT